MKSLKSSIALALAFTLATPPVLAGPQNEARAYVQNSREGARDKARAVFQEYLLGAANQASGVLKYSDSFNKISSDLSVQMKDLEKLRLQLAQAVEKAEAPQDTSNVERVVTMLQEIYQTTSDLYVSARAAEKKRDYLILKNGQTENELKTVYANFLDNIRTTCKNGIAANYEFPNLPAIRPILPSYSFGVSITANSDGITAVDPSIPTTQTEKLNGETAEALYAVSYAGGFVLGAYLLTGKVVMTAAAAQSLTAAQALGATGIGVGVAAVVALAVYFDGLFSAIEQSRDVSDAMWIVHNNKANAETVRQEFKSICQPFAEKAENVAKRIEAIRLSEPQAIADLKLDREVVREYQIELFELQSAFDQEMKKIKAEIDTDASTAKASTEEKQQVLMKRFSATKAYSDMQKFVKNAKSEFLMKSFEVALIDMGLHTLQVEEAMKSQYKELFKNKTEQHLKKIIGLAVLGRRMAIPSSVKELVTAEVTANQKVADLYRQFDANFAGYVQMQLTFGHDDNFKESLKKWLTDVKAAQKTYPKSETLKVLASRGQSFLQFLGVQ